MEKDAKSPSHYITTFSNPKTQGPDFLYLQRMLMLPGKMRHYDSASHLALHLEMTQKERWGKRRRSHPLLSRKLQGATKHGVPAALQRPALTTLAHLLNLKYLQVWWESPSMRHLLSTYARSWAYKVNTISSLLSQTMQAGVDSDNWSIVT